jgi:hypothetical protein
MLVGMLVAPAVALDAPLQPPLWINVYCPNCVDVGLFIQPTPTHEMPAVIWLCALLKAHKNTDANADVGADGAVLHSCNACRWWYVEQNLAHAMQRKLRKDHMATISTS